MTDDELLDAARAVREHAYCPHSNFSVGAALIDGNGDLYVGCNIENASFSQTQCAEASAIGAMVSAGGRHIAKIAVVGGGDALRSCSPCGGCRQRILEFGDADTRVIFLDDNCAPETHSIEDLLPASFRM